MLRIESLRMTTFESLERRDSDAVKEARQGDVISPNTTRGGELTTEVERELIRKCRSGGRAPPAPRGG